MSSAATRACARARARTVIGGVVILIGLAGCVRFQPYAGADAAKVRFTTLGGGEMVSGVRVGVVDVKDGQCGPPALVAVLRNNVSPAPVSRNEPAAPPIAYPRAEMFGSPPAHLPSVAEVRLATGLYSFRMTHSSQIRVCGLSTAFEVEAGHQYTLDFTENDGKGQCTLAGKELMTVGGQPTWQPIDVKRRDPC